jgi:hypothetical protein
LNHEAAVANPLAAGNNDRTFFPAKHRYSPRLNPSVSARSPDPSSWWDRPSDPAKVAGTRDIAAALQKIADAKTPFISRGDNSGTHIAELNLWKAAGVDIAQAKGPWYRDIGQGMGAALNAASATNAYVLSDRGTWLSFKNKG